MNAIGWSRKSTKITSVSSQPVPTSTFKLNDLNSGLAPRRFFLQAARFTFGIVQTPLSRRSILTQLFPSRSGEIAAVPKTKERGNAKTVLVVEDVEEISSQMARMLRGKGHLVIFATDAHEAIKEAKREPPALILTDLDLPSFDTLLNLLEEHEQLKKIDVAVIDINHPHLSRNDIKVLNNFDQLDELLG